MKNILLPSLLLLCIVSSCTHTPTNEEKAKALIEKRLQKTMNDWDSYEFIEMTLDSTYSALESKEFKELRAKSQELSFKQVDLKVNLECPEIYNEQEFKEIRDSIDNIDKELENIQLYILENMRSFSKGFNGFSATFKFRGNNKLGVKVLDGEKFFFDKDITKIIKTAKLDD